MDKNLSDFLNKSPADFKRDDFLRIIEEKGIERLTFHYTALDGRLKELKVPVNGGNQAENILAAGERVDGSSLFRGIVDADVSDLYVIPEYKTAFLNPFDKKSLDFICRFLNKNGDRASFAPDNILYKANSLFQKNTGLDLFTYGELEFFLIYSSNPDIFPLQKQLGYQESAPFRKSGEILDEMVHHISRVTGVVKYSHSEVGFIRSIQSDLEEIRGKSAEQLEVEFLPMPVEDMADCLILSRWIIRNVAFKYGCVATFAPKIELGVAGNGLHFHFQLRKNDKNIMTHSNGRLSEDARRLIGGLCYCAPSLTAFGNTVASSYLRLIPHYEAPTRIFWSDLNRSALIRVPLAWTNVQNLAGKINPQDEFKERDPGSHQTVEFRSPDGSALVYLLLAGIAMSADWAFTSDQSLKLAEMSYIKGEEYSDKEFLDRFPLLPSNCAESAEILVEKRDFYEREGIFPPSIIDYLADFLREENTKVISFSGSIDMRKLMHQYIHIR
jgi:glutamine synthetase